MAKGGLAVGLLVGGLAGFAAGYYFSSQADTGDEGAVKSIDLTPSIELKNGRGGEPKRTARRTAAAPTGEAEQE